MTSPFPGPRPLPAFPPGFQWGVSTSAHQVEGAAGEDGRGPAAWDAFAAQPGRVKDGGTPAVAAGHYHRYREDVALLKGLGVDAYRFSVAWPRVLPSGSGVVNAAGLDFYDRLVDELCEAGIRPLPTLYHWDTPLPVEEAGGWLVRETPRLFAAYADTVAARLGDRVRQWVTLDEPAELTFLGYGLGAHAPGRRLLFDALPAAHHQLLGHGLAMAALRARGARCVGIANSHGPVRPVSRRRADAGAAELYDTLTNRLFAEPLLLGRYPDETLAALLPGPVEDDLRTIAQPLDFYGVNYYRPALVGAPASSGPHSPARPAESPAELPFTRHEVPGRPRTDFGWSVVPEGLPELLHLLRERYGDRLPPVVVTGNGCAYGDRTADRRRIDYLAGHLRELHRAMAEGADVRGYFVRSLLDTFEWAEGYAQRFGLVHVDHATLERTPRDSYRWLRHVLRAQRARCDGAAS